MNWYEMITESLPVVSYGYARRRKEGASDWDNKEWMPDVLYYKTLTTIVMSPFSHEKRYGIVKMMTARKPARKAKPIIFAGRGREWK